MPENAILVLEDNYLDFLFLVEELSEFGFSEGDFYLCKSIHELSDPAIQDLHPTFIFADLNLADSTSSLDTFLYVQNLFPTLPVVVFTGLKDEDVAIKCIQAGAQNFLVKGTFTAAQLLQVIKYATEQNRMKQELEKLKADYQNLFDENPLPMFVVDDHTSKFIAVNKAAVGKYGYSKEEFSNLPLETISRNAEELNKPRLNNSSYTCHYKKNGDTLYVEEKNNQIFYKNIFSRLITVNDVTEKVLAEEEERKAKQRLDAIFSGTNDAILLTDDKGRYVQVNDAACFMLGFSQDEFLSLSVPDIVAKMYIEGNDENLWDKFLHKGSQSGIIELKTKSSEIIICHYNATANVLPGLHLSILTNVTEREHARRRIEEQKKRIENILDSITDGFFAVDKNWLVKYWNKAAEKLLKQPREKILGDQLWHLFEDAKNMRFYSEYHKAIADQVPVRFEEYYETLHIWLDVTAYPTNEGLTVYFKDISADKKQALEILQAKNNQAALINNTGDLIWSVDREMKLVSYNTAYKNTIEEQDDVQVREGLQLPANFHNKDSFEQWKGYYQRALAGEAFSIDIPVVHTKTGYIKRAEITFNPIYAIDFNNVEAVACYSHDVTLRLQYQSLIEEQNKRLRADEEHLKKMKGKLEKVMNSSVDIICSIGKDGRFVQVSEASKNILGYSPHELVGKIWKELVPEAYREITEKTIKEVVSGKPQTNLRNVFIGKNKTQVPLIWSMRWDAEEETMFCVARDASSLVEAEKSKAESEQRFTSLVQKGADMVAILNENADYIYASPNVKSILGFDPESLINHNAMSFIHPDDIPIAYKELENVLRENEVKLEAFRHMDANGEWRWIETIATNQLNNPAIGGIVINSRDITKRTEREKEREQMIKELLKSNADLKQFSFITSHNLRAPLSNIVGILNIIDHSALDPYNSQMVEMLNTSTKQLEQTINDLAKILIIKNNINIEVSLIDLKESVYEVKKIFLNSLNDVCADISVDFKVKNIFFNKTYFESIVVNLLSNSIKYRSPDRRLIIDISSDLDQDGNVIFRFSDNGSGIDMNKHKNKLFGLYQRFHDKTDGQGLGLFIIKSQIVALGGKIEVESNIDKGTAFTITFKAQSSAFINRFEAELRAEVK